MATAYDLFELSEIFKKMNADESLHAIDTKSPKIKGNFNVVDNVHKKESDEDYHVEIHYPVYTRPVLSKFEYEGVITTLAEYLENIDSISKYTLAANVNSLINTAELAYQLLKQGKMDCTIIRNEGLEKVSFSVLKRNKQWDELIENYFKTKSESLEEEFYSKLK